MLNKQKINTNTPAIIIKTNAVHYAKVIFMCAKRAHNIFLTAQYTIKPTLTQTLHILTFMLYIWGAINSPYTLYTYIL